MRSGRRRDACRLPLGEHEPGNAMILSLQVGRKLSVLAVLPALVPVSGAAQAQSCNFSIGNASFGVFSSVAGTAVDTTATFSATCSGTKGRTVRICPNIGSGTGGNNAAGTERYLLNGANQLKFNFYQDAAHASVWGSAVWPYPPLPPVIDVALTGGSGNATGVIYGRIFANQTALPSGVYASAFSGGHTLFAYQYRNDASPQTCSTIGSANGKQVPFTATATLTPACDVQATAMNFGTAANLTANIDTTNTVTVRCSSGTPYALGLNGGLSNAADPAQRKMTNPATSDAVTYGIYRDAARTQPWGATAATNAVSATGNGSAQTFTGYGRVPPQISVTPLDYNDTVIATVTY
jgi:spore coat protein U-like protein